MIDFSNIYQIDLIDRFQHLESRIEIDQWGRLFFVLFEVDYRSSNYL